MNYMPDLKIMKRRNSRYIHIIAYDKEENMRQFDSVLNCAKFFHVSDKTIRRRIKLGEEINGYTLYLPKNDPHIQRKKKFEMSAKDDLPVVMFDRFEHQNLGTFKSVTFLAKCLSRSVEDVLGWVKGTKRCTDLDCYYKYLKDCTPEELNNKYITK